MEIGELEDVSTSYNLNPQSFIGLRCRKHPEHFVQWICLENDQVNKLYCSLCWINLRDKEEKAMSGESPTSAGVNLIDYKIFLKNLYNFCTLEEGDPERFNSELVGCLEGCKQQEKLKMFMGNVGGIREDVLGSFKQQASLVFQEMQEKVSMVFKKINAQFEGYLESETDSLFSRDTLSIKQFKERACKLVLSAVKTATLTDDPRAFEALNSAINRLHSGQVELSYARQHAHKLFKVLISELKSKLIAQTQETLQSQLQLNLTDIQDQYRFLPKKNTSGGLRSVNFSYLQQSRLLGLPEMTNKFSYLSPSKSTNNLENNSRKFNSSTSQQPFIIKQLQPNSFNSQNRSVQQITNSPDLCEKDNLKALTRSIISPSISKKRDQDFNVSPIGGKLQYPGASLFSTFSTTLRGSFSSGIPIRRLKQHQHTPIKGGVQTLDKQQQQETDLAGVIPEQASYYVPNSFSRKSLKSTNNASTNKILSSSLNSIIQKQTEDKTSDNENNQKNLPRKPSIISNAVQNPLSEDANLSGKCIIPISILDHGYPEISSGTSKAIIQSQIFSDKSDEVLSNSESTSSKTKSIVSNGGILGRGKKLKETPEGLLQEKTFKHNILALIRISNKLIKHKLFEMAEEKDNSPIDSDDFGGLVMAERDGFLSVYCAQGSEIMQVYREKAHEKLISIAKGRTGHMFFTAGEQAQGLGQASIKLWMVHANLRLSELVELKMVETNIQEIFFIREEFAASLSKLSFCVWTKIDEQEKTASHLHHTQNKATDDITTNISSKNDQGITFNPSLVAVNGSGLINNNGLSSVQGTDTKIISLSNIATQSNSLDKINVWNLEFNSHKFENARMFSAATIELPANIIGVNVIDDELLAFTKNCLHQYVFFSEFQTLKKKTSQKFINILPNDTLVEVRKYTTSLTKAKQFFAFSESGLVYTLSDQIQILYEKSLRDLAQRPINLINSIIFKRESDLPENVRFVYFFLRDSKVLYVFDLETQKIIDSAVQPEEIKDLFFYGIGKFLAFEQATIKSWKELPAKTELLYPQHKFVSLE